MKLLGWLSKNLKVLGLKGFEIKMIKKISSENCLRDENPKVKKNTNNENHQLKIKKILNIFYLQEMGGWSESERISCQPKLYLQGIWGWIESERISYQILYFVGIALICVINFS